MADVLYTGISGLISYQRALSTTGHNISNADTVGYSRQRTLFTTRTPQNTGTGWIGNGVRVLAVERQYDDFLATQTRSTQSAASNLESFTTYAVRVDSLLADPDLRRDCGEAGKALVHAHYAFDRVVDTLDELYRQVAHGRG